jgi:hypothetical protein
MKQIHVASVRFFVQLRIVAMLFYGSFSDFGLEMQFIA